MTSCDLKVFWDGYDFGGQSSGIFHHTLNLARELNKQGVRPSLFLTQKRNEFLDFDCIIIKRANCLKKILDSKIIWPLLVKRRLLKGLNVSSLDNKDKIIFHGLSNINIPLLGFGPRIRTVVTIHDLIPILAAGEVSRSYSFQYRFIMPNLLKIVNKVVCVSNWTKVTLLEHFKVSEDKVDVIPNGMDGLVIEGKTKEEDSSLIRLLFVGRYEPYKRLDWLLELVRAYKEKFFLTIVTNQNGRAFCRKKGLDLLSSGNLKLFSDLKKEALSELFKTSDVYVHPSLYEGFCLPAAEALSYGLPVVYQSGSGINEVAGTDVGLPLERGSSMDYWISAIEMMYQKSREKDFLDRIRIHFKSKNSWKDCAKALKFLYEHI